MSPDRQATVAVLIWTAIQLLLAPLPALGALSASALYRTPVVREMALSPSGSYLASIVTRRGRERIVLRKRDDDREVMVQTDLLLIRRLFWIDEERLAVLFGGVPMYHVVTASNAVDELVIREDRVRARGYLVDPLPNMGEEVLWAVRAGGNTSVYRIEISELLGERARTFADDEGRLVAQLEGNVYRWVADGSAVVRAALKLGRGSKKTELWYRAAVDAEWRLLQREAEPEDIAHPFAIAENEHDLVVAARGERDTFALFELSTETGELGRELFSHPDADIIDVILDHSARREVIGVVYEEDGLPQFHHLDSFFDLYQRSLSHALPDMVLRITGVSRDRRYFLVVAGSPRDPGTYYLLDTRAKTATVIARQMPWLDSAELASVDSFRVKSTDGLEIEAFLTRPNGARKPPLVVMPHGGPRNVRDSRLFNPLAQFLAAGGMAVLQVNYRGSSGRGKAFLDAGKREWGAGIEEDLDAAFDEMVRRGLVDGDRACIAGGSYGGYSALMSAIRSPERYLCAASLNGPTDLPFAFHFGFDWSDEGREYFDEYIADPDDLESLQTISPVYRASEIRIPVLLAQGTEDRIVDLDHYYRMANVLDALGKPYESYLMYGARHSPKRSEWVGFALRLRKFLLAHLQSP